MQVENEYKNVEAAFHEKGPSYVRWAALMAVNLHTGVPWVMCKQDDAPDPVVSSLVLQCLAFSNCCFKGNPPFSGLEDVQSACWPPSSVLRRPCCALLPLFLEDFFSLTVTDGRRAFCEGNSAMKSNV